MRGCTQTTTPPKLENSKMKGAKGEEADDD